MIINTLIILIYDLRMLSVFSNRSVVKHAYFDPRSCNNNSSMNNIIEEDYFAVNELLLFAKEGHWDGVFDILGLPTRPKKAYLMNIIPEERRWGILHQSLYWKNEAVLKRLLQYPSCDPNIITKVYTTESGEKTHDSAVEVAKKHEFIAAERILETHTFDSQEQDTFLPENGEIDRNGLSIMAITLAANKTTFHPKTVNRKLTIFQVLQKIYKEMNTTDSWKKIRDIIYDYAFVIDAGEGIGRSTTREDFYKAFICVYTDESTWLYDIMNTALRKQKTANYRPSGNDLAIGPFITTFQMVILFWDQLPRESGTTYRQVLLTEKDLNQYQVGVKFSWHTFVSSAKHHGNAMNFPTVEGSGDCVVMFIIDNSRDSFWRPRDVNEYSINRETERLYPIGARFKVRKVTKKDTATDIELKLL